MTGIIRSLDTGSASGYIKADNGLSVHFDLSAVLAYDAATLAVGQAVTFDLESGSRPMAVNVCVQNHYNSSHARDRHTEAVQLRYIGFEQAANVRVYRFDRVSPREQTSTLTVRIELDLLARHRLGIQEGPALCLRLLLAELGAVKSERQPLERRLTEQHILAYLAGRPAPKSKTRPRRVSRPAGAGQIGA